MSSPATILLVEGVRPVASLAPPLEAKGYHVVRANSAKEALNAARAHAPALAVVDCTTLHTDGLRICGDLRASVDALPIVIVVRRGVDPGKITCADSVLARPFTPRKMLNRIARLLPDSAGEVLQVGDLALNIESHYLRVGRAEHHLTPMKTRLLEAFMRNPGETLSREFLMKTVWKTDYIGDTRTIEVHVRWLRQIIEADPCDPKLLQTVRGVGYRLTVEASR